MNLEVPINDIAIHNGCPRTVLIEIDTEDDVSGLSLTARFAAERDRKAVIETALTYFTDQTVIEATFGHPSTKVFALVISASDARTIKNEWACDVFNSATGLPVAKLDVAVEAAILDNPLLP